MAILMEGITRCALTNKVLTKEDVFLCFPAFPCTPHEPIYLCYRACALRSAFNAWEFRNDVLERVKDFWSQNYHRSNAFDMLIEDEDFLVVKGNFEAKIRIFFIRHNFAVDIPVSYWVKFYSQLTDDWEGEIVIHPYSKTHIHLQKTRTQVQLCQQIEGFFGRDCIELSLHEWLDFRSMVVQLNALVN
jgi:hypothetical protein